MNSYALEPVGFIQSTVKGRADAPRLGPEGAPDAWLEIDPPSREGYGETGGIRRIKIDPIEAFNGTPVVDIKSASTRAEN
jgi:tRNA (Thr-GGU) A37 N-methylase